MEKKKIIIIQVRRRSRKEKEKDFSKKKMVSKNVNTMKVITLSRSTL